MRILLIISLFLFSVNVFAQSEDDAVKQVVTTAYIKGIHNGGTVEDIRKGFHPSFNMLRLINNEVSPLPLEDWIVLIEKSRIENPPANRPAVEGKFINVAVTGNAANVILDLYRDNKKIFTDNLLLFKFNEGWRIVSKSFYRHP